MKGHSRNEMIRCTGIEKENSEAESQNYEENTLIILMLWKNRSKE